MKATKEVTICDFCQEHESYEVCIGCGKTVCWDCREKKELAVQYPHGVYHSGSGDGTYCNDCDVKLKDDPLHMAYIAVTEQRKEAMRLNDLLNKRTKLVELNLQFLIDRKSK